jgi:hypothetical protein
MNTFSSGAANTQQTVCENVLLPAAAPCREQPGEEFAAVIEGDFALCAVERPEPQLQFPARRRDNQNKTG